MSQDADENVISLPEENVPLTEFVVGSKCLIKSVSRNQWCLGLVIAVEKSTIVVTYFARYQVEINKPDGTVENTWQKTKKEKALNLANENDKTLIKKFDESHMGEEYVEIPHCLCDNTLILKKLPRYNAEIGLSTDKKNDNKDDDDDNDSKEEKKDENPQENPNESKNKEKEKEKEQDKDLDELAQLLRAVLVANMANVVIVHKCTVCNKDIDDNMGYYCPNGESEIHKEGFYECINCVMDRMGFIMRGRRSRSSSVASNASNSGVDVPKLVRSGSQELKQSDENSGSIVSDGGLVLSDNDQNNEDDEKDPYEFDEMRFNGAEDLGSKPFAQGSSMYAYLGKFNFFCAILNRFV